MWGIVKLLDRQAVMLPNLLIDYTTVFAFGILF